MVLTLEREGSLTDIRRTQRRVAALMMYESHIELLRYPLRRRILPKGFCYVCSRIDPSGIFRKPNSHLYKKGFFHSCEHFPKAPYTTFVQEEAIIEDNDEGESLTEYATNRTEAISVTIRKGSQSTKFPSPVKREGTFDSPFSQLDRGVNSTSQDQGVRSRVSDNIFGRRSLPSFRRDNASGLKGVGRLDVFKTPSGAQTRLSKRSILDSETLPAGSESGIRSVTDRITVIPTAFDDKSAISELSPFTAGTTPSKSTNDLDSKFESDETSVLKSLASKHSHTTKTSGSVSESFSKGSHSTRPQAPIINQTDGLEDVYTVAPLLRETVLLESSPEYLIRRPKAGHNRERQLPRRRVDSSDGSVSTHRPESGHLRYHHRGDIDSVPDPGFEIPPTPSEDISEIERNNLEQGSNKITGSSNVSDSTISEDASLSLSEKTRRSRRKLPRVPSENKSFCRCTSGSREISFSRNVCKTCGKACHAVCGNGDSSQSASGNDKDTVISSSKHTTSTSKHTVSSDKHTVSTRRDMLQRDDMRLNLRSKVTDEDYMDLDSIIHEDDGRYWSSDEEYGVPGQSPVSWYRYKHAQPYALVDPDIHKIVYIKALKAAQIKGKKAKDLVFDEFQKLRRPNVFSYIPLLPRIDKNNPEPKQIGIRPDDSDKPKKGQYMKHIFGDIKLDDFYPRGKFGNGRAVVIDDSSKVSSTEESLTERTTEEESTKKSKEPERSSVSLKLRKQGISFDDDV